MKFDCLPFLSVLRLFGRLKRSDIWHSIVQMCGGERTAQARIQTMVVDTNDANPVRQGALVNASIDLSSRN